MRIPALNPYPGFCSLPEFEQYIEVPPDIWEMWINTVLWRVRTWALDLNYTEPEYHTPVDPDYYPGVHREYVLSFTDTARNFKTGDPGSEVMTTSGSPYIDEVRKVCPNDPSTYLSVDLLNGFKYGIEVLQMGRGGVLAERKYAFFIRFTNLSRIPVLLSYDPGLPDYYPTPNIAGEFNGVSFPLWAGPIGNFDDMTAAEYAERLTGYVRINPAEDSDVGYWPNAHPDETFPIHDATDGTFLIEPSADPDSEFQRYP